MDIIYKRSAPKFAREKFLLSRYRCDVFILIVIGLLQYLQIL